VTWLVLALTIAALLGVAFGLAALAGLLAPELIGPDECPIIKRWTLLQFGRREEVASSVAEDNAERRSGYAKQADDAGGKSGVFRQRPRRWKLLLHRFPGRVDDRDVHDHPRRFWTLVLWGSYVDATPCPTCRGTGTLPFESPLPWGPIFAACDECAGRGERFETVRAGTVHFRPANHTHRTIADRGAWTLVLMGPIERPWGFVSKDGRWWPWREYRAKFGHGTVCDKDAP
jgi:hypothetical protein